MKKYWIVFAVVAIAALVFAAGSNTKSDNSTCPLGSVIAGCSESATGACSESCESGKRCADCPASCPGKNDDSCCGSCKSDTGKCPSTAECDKEGGKKAEAEPVSCGGKCGDKGDKGGDKKFDADLVACGGKCGDKGDKGGDKKIA